MADLENVYTDHLRFEYVSWAFLQVGFRVFSTPLGEIGSVVHAVHPHLHWVMHPSLNPLGVVFYFLPFGAISNLGIISDVSVHKLMVFSFLVAGYSCVYYFTLNWKESKHNLVTYVLLPIVFYLSSTYWALNGFYDLIPVLLIILSIQAYNKNDIFKGILLLAAAMLMHYRSLMYFPLLAYLLFRLWKRNNKKSNMRRKLLAFAVVLIIGLLDGYTFNLTFISKDWAAPTGWIPSPAYILDLKNSYCAIFFLATSFGVWFYLFRKGKILSSTIIFFFWVYISFIGSWGSWHALFFFPALLLPNDKRSKEAFSLWLLVSMFLLGSFVTPVQLVSPVGRMSPRYANVSIRILGEGLTEPTAGNYTSFYLEGQNLFIEAIPAQGWCYDHMKRNGIEWTHASPGGFLDLYGNETVEVVFVSRS